MEPWAPQGSASPALSPCTLLNAAAAGAAVVCSQQLPPWEALAGHVSAASTALDAQQPGQQPPLPDWAHQLHLQLLQHSQLGGGSQAPPAAQPVGTSSPSVASFPAQQQGQQQQPERAGAIPPPPPFDYSSYTAAWPGAVAAASAEPMPATAALQAQPACTAALPLPGLAELLDDPALDDICIDDLL